MMLLYGGTERASTLDHGIPGKLVLNPLSTTHAHGFCLAWCGEQVDNCIGNLGTTVAINPQARHPIDNGILSPATFTTDHRLAGGASFQIYHAEAFDIAVNLAIGHN